jgi:DNA repair protein RecO
MEKIRDLAIVLRAVAYEERHRVVTAITERHGMISAMARNSIQSRRFGGTLDSFTASEWIFTQKPGAELFILEQAEIKKSFEGLRADFEKLSMASVFSELMLKLAPQQSPAPDLFKLHSNALLALEEADHAPIQLLNAYLAKLLQWSGSQPKLMACMKCEVSLTSLDDQIAVSCMIQDAGWVCPACRGVDTRHVRERGTSAFDQSLLRVMPFAIVDFLLSLSVPIRQIVANTRASKQDHQELFKFLEALFIYHIPGFDRQPLKGLRFLESTQLLPSKSLQ